MSRREYLCYVLKVHASTHEYTSIIVVIVAKNSQAYFLQQYPEVAIKCSLLPDHLRFERGIPAPDFYNFESRNGEGGLPAGFPELPF